jgi:hypothetical protein
MTRPLLAIGVFQSRQTALSDSDTLRRHDEIPYAGIGDDDYARQDRRRRHASATDGSGKSVTIGSLTDTPLSVKNDVPDIADRSLSVALLYSLPGSQFSDNNNVSSV